MLTNLLKDLYPIITKSAPVIASALGANKIGEVSMWALYLIGKAFGISMDQIDKLPEVISNDPEHCDKLCQIEKTFGNLFDKTENQLLKEINLSNIEINIKLNFGNEALQNS